MTKTVRMMGLGLALWTLNPELALAEPAPKPTEYEFSDDLVKGDLIRPDVAVLQSRGKSARSSLIDLRATFVQELLKSVEDL